MYIFTVQDLLNSMADEDEVIKEAIVISINDEKENDS